MLMTPRTLTIPSTMSNSAMRHAVPDHDLQKMLRRQVQALRFQFLSMAGNLLTHVWAWLPTRQEVFSSLDIIFSHISQPQQEYLSVHWIRFRLWSLDISHHSSAVFSVPCGASDRTDANISIRSKMFRSKLIYGIRTYTLIVWKCSF